MTVILASTSVIRRKLLENAGIGFTVEKPGVDETALKRASPGLPPQALARNLAEAKAISVSKLYPNPIVVGADQILSLAGQTFDKPENREAARAQLRALKGRTHDLVSAVCCAREGKILWQCVDRAELTIRKYSDQFLETYLDDIGADAMASVGAYQLEGRGIQLFEEIKGDYFTILGLPLLPLLKFLRTAHEAGA